MGRYAKAAERASKLTDKQLKKEIAVFVLKIDKLQELLPDRGNQEAFLNLMKVVEDETDMDEKLAYLETNVKTVGKVIIQVLRGLV